MTPDRKLLILGVAFLAACGIGAQSWLAMSDDRSESGFDGDDPFPLVSTTAPSPPIEFDVPMSARNPFEFVAVGSAEGVPADTTDDTTDTGDTAASDGNASPTSGGTSSTGGTTSDVQNTTAPTQPPSTTTSAVADSGSFDDLRRDDSPVDPDDERGR